MRTHTLTYICNKRLPTLLQLHYGLESVALISLGEVFFHHLQVFLSALGKVVLRKIYFTHSVLAMHFQTIKEKREEAGQRR